MNEYCETSTGCIYKVKDFDGLPMCSNVELEKTYCDHMLRGCQHIERGEDEQDKIHQ